MTHLPARDRFSRSPSPEHEHLTPAQVAWMKENKPLYYTGRALTDIHHLPQHLRHV